MKKILLTGIIILIAAFVVTCDEGLTDADAVEYTDVVYSPDGSEVTIYLDGAKVPVTKAQRAMSKDLAQMAYDYLEVIFISGSTIARSAWELGEPANISGVARATPGVDYVFLSGTPAACLFVGKKDGKTLLGVGGLVEADGGGNTTVVTPNSTYVKFALSAIQTGLTVLATSPGATTNENTAGSTHPRGVLVDSLKYVNTNTDIAYQGKTNTNTSLATLGGVQYPMFGLPAYSGTGTKPTVDMTYTIDFVENTTNYTTVTKTLVKGAIKHLQTTIGVTAVTGAPAVPVTSPLVQRRVPRYMDGGRYLEPKQHIDTKTTVAFSNAWLSSSNNTSTTAAWKSFQSDVGLTFTVGGSGIFSFYLKLPVFNNTINFATNGGPDYTKWYITTGYGSELYSLDDGASSGGCVLMGAGVSAPEWLEIIWDWI